MNNLPQGWQNKPLGEIVKTITTGKTPSTQVVDYFNGAVNWFTPSDIGKSKFLVKSTRTLTQKAISEGKATLFEGNTLLITCIGDIGRVGVLRTASSSNQQITGIKFDESIDVNYAYYWFLKNSYKLANLANNAVVPILNNAQLKEIAFQYPPINIQKKLADLLDKADSIRKKRQESIRLADEFLRSTFLNMFGDPKTNPMNWNKEKLSEYMIGDPQNGFFAKNIHYNHKGVPIIWISDFLDEFYMSVNNLKRVTATQEEIERYSLQYGDVLFCRSSLTAEGIGKASIVPRDLCEKTIYECHIIKIHLNSVEIIPEFFRSLSDTQYYRSQIMKNSKTSTMTTISQEGITNTEIIIPPIEIQKEYLNKVLHQIELIKKHHLALTDSENLFNSLMQRAFKGEL